MSKHGLRSLARICRAPYSIVDAQLRRSEALVHLLNLAAAAERMPELDGAGDVMQ